MAKKEDKRYLFGQFRCEECGKTVTGPCKCVCPHCGHKMFETMMWQCGKLLQYSMACMSAVYEDKGQTLTEEQQFQLHGPKSAELLRDARIMIDDGWNYIHSELKEIGAALDAIPRGGDQSRNLAGAIVGIAGLAFGVFLLSDDSLTTTAVILMIVSAIFFLIKGKRVLDGLRARMSLRRLDDNMKHSKLLHTKLGAIDDVHRVMVKLGAFEDDARAAAENLSPEAYKLFNLIIDESKPYSKRILEGLRAGDRTVDEVVDSVFSLKRL